MGRPYSLDLRENVVAAVRSGISRREAAAHFSIVIPSAVRWTKREADTGSAADKAGDIVVLDNLGSHKGQLVGAKIWACVS